MRPNYYYEKDGVFLMKNIHWTLEVYDEFISLATLAGSEQRVLDSIVKNGRSVRGTAYALDMSDSAVSDNIRRIKQQYRRCMEHSELLRSAWTD